MEFCSGITIGSDVEFFVAHSNGAVASAEGHIPGTKKNPALFVPGNKFFATQLDNVLAEGNIPPAASPRDFISYMNRLRSHMDALLAPKGLHTVARAAAHLPDKYLQTDNAKTFGCDESFNCWTLKPEPVTPTDSSLRSAGFHIHLGYFNPSEEVNIALARIMDATLGLPAVIEEPKSDRRKLGYGRAGNFRHQKHGVEYRTLSSHWADSHRYWAYNCATRAAQIMNSERVGEVLKELSAAGDDIQEAINTDSVGKARGLIAKLGRYIAFHNPSAYGVHT